MGYDRVMRLRYYTVLLGLLLAMPVAAKEVLPWIENDHAEAAEELLRADRLASEDKHAEAAAAYEEALKTLSKKSLRYGRAAEGLIFSFAMMHDTQQRCADRGLELARELKGTVSGANIASEALDCESSLKPENRNAETFATLEKTVSANVHDNTLDLSGDDRSGYYISLIGARDAMKDEAGGKKLAPEGAAL